jgi:hypothetical protein
LRLPDTHPVRAMASYTRLWCVCVLHAQVALNRQKYEAKMRALDEETRWQLTPLLFKGAPLSRATRFVRPTTMSKLSLQAEGSLIEAQLLENVLDGWSRAQSLSQVVIEEQDGRYISRLRERTASGLPRGTGRVTASSSTEAIRSPLIDLTVHPN